MLQVQMQYGTCMDGLHKLIKWRFVTHGGIDRYSRTVVFLKCSDNNQASTVFTLFSDAVESHGLPSRIRTDLGGGNVEVWRYMVEQHASRHAVITGPSAHNERIERLWRDVYRCVGVVFADTFRALEADDHLDCLNEGLTSTVYISFFYPGSIQFLLNLLNPGTIIHRLAHIILLLTSYLFVEQSNRI